MQSAAGVAAAIVASVAHRSSHPAGAKSHSGVASTVNQQRRIALQIDCEPLLRSRAALQRHGLQAVTAAVASPREVAACVENGTTEKTDWKGSVVKGGEGSGGRGPQGEADLDA